jgi:tetratricopeptide (TPR) repeat protein
MSSVIETFAQNRNIDSLLTLIKTDKEDTNKVKHLYKVCREYQLISESDNELNYSKQALTLAQKLGYKKGIGNAYNCMGVIYQYQGAYSEALKNYFAALKFKEEIKDKQGIADSYNNIGNVYFDQGNYPEALKMHFASLKIREETGYKGGIAACYGNIGNVYMYQGNYPEALKNYFAALKIKEEIGDNQGIADCNINIGSIYLGQGNYHEALKNYFASLKIYEELKNKYGIANSYLGIGGIYDYQHNYPQALKNYFASLKIREEIGDKEGIATSFINLGSIYTKENKTKEAEDYINKALELSKEIGSKEDIKGSYAVLTFIDSTMGNYKAAFAHHKLYIIYRDSLNNEETKKKSLQSTMQYEFDKKEIATKAQQEKIDAINIEEKQKQQVVIYAVAGVLLLVIVFSIFLFNRFRIANRQKHIIEQQKEQVDQAYSSLHEKNKEVLDSIRYAKRIQAALITNEKYIANSLNRLMRNN